MTKAPAGLGSRPPSSERRTGPGAPARVPAVRDAVDVAVLTGLALALWAGTVAVGRAWGLQLIGEGRRIVLFTPPVLGGYRPEVPARLWLPVVVGVGLVALLPAAVSRLRWPATVLAGTAAAAAWGVALALVDGVGALTDGLDWAPDSAPVVGRVAADPLGFLRGYTTDLPGYPIALRGHPPGFALLVGLLDRVGLAGPGWASAVVLLVALSAVPAVALTVRTVAGEDLARRSLPFLALAPAAVWLVISVDALYVGVTAWLVLLLVRAMASEGRRSLVLAVGAGVLAALAALLSYGLVLIACVPIAVALGWRRWRPLAVAGGVAAALVLALVPLGFSWFAGLAATKHEYDTLDLDRPYSYFVVNNLAAWALVIGPATAAGLARLRDRRLWLLVGGGLAAVVLADLSGLSEGEVERIWLPFSIWVLPAAAVLATRPWTTRAWLSIQATTALVLTATIGTRW